MWNRGLRGLAAVAFLGGLAGAPLGALFPVYVDSELAATTPVLLTLDGARAPASDVLLTLDDETPPDFNTLFARYERVIEVVSRNDNDRARARARFKTYRDHGFKPTTFEVAGRE
jgi:DNA polymerase-3 subunit chi